jgi:TRAP-type mannitol/chloroaromatic compound transport system permease small subunit
MIQAMRLIADGIDAVNTAIGRLLVLLLPLVVLIASTVVVLRYVFAVGFPWLAESYIWLNGLIMVIGAGYVLKIDKHVRVDVFYKIFPERAKAVVNILGVLLLLWPSLYVLYEFALPFVLRSWRMHEISPTSDGLPAMYLLKSGVLAFCLLCALQGLALLLRSVLTLLATRSAETYHA